MSKKGGIYLSANALNKKDHILPIIYIMSTSINTTCAYSLIDICYRASPIYFLIIL